MTLYFVLDASPADRRVSLYDSFGHYHVARASEAMPAVGAELHGGPPFQGTSIRDASPTGEVSDMVLEVVDCRQGAALGPPTPGDEMSQKSTPPADPGKQQREALQESQRRAAEQQPENFKDEATDDKVVEIGPDLTNQPIKGIDPPPQRKGQTS